MIVWIPGLQLDLFAKLCGKFFTWRPAQLFFLLRWIMWSLTGHWLDEGGKSAWKNDISTTSPVTCAVRSRLFVCFCLSTHVSNVRVRARFFLIASHCVLRCVHAVSISSHPSAIYLTRDLFPFLIKSLYIGYHLFKLLDRHFFGSDWSNWMWRVEKMPAF